MTLALAVISFCALHVGTASYPEITILERALAIEVRADVLLFADYVDFGVPRGGSLSREALLARTADVGALTARSIRVTLNGAVVDLAAEDVGVIAAESGRGPGLFRVRLAARSAEPIRELVIDYGLFREHDPAHRGYARIRRAADELSYVFARGIPFRWRADETRDGVLPKTRAWLAFLLDGVEHILAGLDHILFLFGLVVAARNAMAVAKTVTGFTIAHSLTLGLGAAGVVTLPRVPVEVAIALSVAWVGAQNLLRREGGTRWVVTLLFGLVHGLGFSEALAGAAMPALEFAAALTFFNVGVEAGQLMLLLLALPPLLWLRDRAPRAHRGIVIAGSAAILVTGLVWAAQRIAGP